MRPVTKSSKARHSAALALYGGPGPMTKQKTLEGGFYDARTGMPSGIPEGAMCVQRFDDSLNSAIHTTYRISLRSSSMREPRDPLLKVLTFCISVSDVVSDGMESESARARKRGFLQASPGGAPRGSKVGRGTRGVCFR